MLYLLHWSYILSKLVVYKLSYFNNMQCYQIIDGYVLIAFLLFLSVLILSINHKVVLNVISVKHWSNAWLRSSRTLAFFPYAMRDARWVSEGICLSEFVWTILVITVPSKVDLKYSIRVDFIHSFIYFEIYQQQKRYFISLKI